MYMHGRVAKEGENRRPTKIVLRRTGSGQHMQSVLSSTPTRTCVEENGNSLRVSTATDTPASFSKDGRKISVGDCALFKPPHDSPPFIGVISSLAFSEEKNLQLVVTWLYRPAEVKLGKGILLDAAPNEIFYSFHKDEIPAASLLHPCKVAFLPKGVELPKGISSFVCRRVYDIENKCLWWLTDQDYIYERQEEVNKLLNRTQKEMDSVVQAGGCSPTVTSAASHLKSASDNLQNSATSAPSQMKGKKRERGDQSCDPVKREHPSKTGDGDSGSVMAGNLLRMEIAKIAEKERLVDSESVEKLLELIRPRMDNKLDLVTRSVVTGVIAATDRLDCLSQFVQLKGLSVLDEWLQDVHKGRISDSGSRDGYKSVEEFLLVLLRALDKLPVNLHALQTCNIGRSVNHLRSHKNMEIQRKARSLVDTWKKRVEAEMNVIDAKSGSPQAAAWSSKSRMPEVNGGRTSGGSCDVALKSSVTQPAESKAASTKASPVEAMTKSTCLSPGAVKSAAGKDVKPRTAPNNAADVPTCGREDKNSSSALPHTANKEDSRFPMAGTVNNNKIASGGSRHWKSNNGFTETADPGSQKETVSCRSSFLHDNTAQSMVVGEKTSTVPVTESNSHKLIVKIPNRSRTAGQCPSGGSGDPSVMSGRASPVLSYGRESDHNSKICETYLANLASHVNVELLHGNNHKDVQVGSEGDGSSAALHDEDISKNVDENRKTAESSRTPFSSLEKDLKVKQLCEASSTAMDALIESCAKYSDECASTSPGDDVGMNLLARVAAEEMCSSEFATLACSLQQNAPPEEECVGDISLSKTSADNLPLDGGLSDAASNAENEKKVAVASGLGSREGIHLSKEVSIEHSGDRKMYSALSDGMIKMTADCGSVMDEKSSNAFLHSSEEPEIGQDDGKTSVDEKQICFTAEVCCVSDTKADGSGSSVAEVERGKVVSSAEHSKKVERSPSIPSVEIDCKEGISKSSKSNFIVEMKPSLKADGEISQPIVSSEEVCETLDEVDTGQADRNCIDGKMVLGSALPSQDVEGDEKLGISKSSVAEGNKMEKKAFAAVDDAPLSAAVPAEMDSKMDFDLNEVILGDDGMCEEPPNLGISGGLGILLGTNSLSTPVSVGFTCTSALVTVSAAAKVHLVPPVDLLRSKGELGGKGLATTSAFWPTEPRKISQNPTNAAFRDNSTSNLYPWPFNIDLNVADEKILEEMTCQGCEADMPSTSDNFRFQGNSCNDLIGSSLDRSGGLDLDLNRVDDANFTMQYSASSSHRLADPPVPFKSLFPSSLPTTEVKRNFDLNNGPGFDDGVAEQSSSNQLGGGSMPCVNSFLPVSNLRPNSLEIGNLSCYFPHANPYPSVTISSVLPDRGEHQIPIVTSVTPQRILGPLSGNPLLPDMYRGTVLSSSPAVPFPSGPFPYQMFPFGTTLPSSSGTSSVGSASYLDSASAGRLSIPTVNSQFLGPVSAVSSQYPKSFMIGLPDGRDNSGVDSSGRKWSTRSLDLNAGPGGLDVEGRDNFMPQRQLLSSSFRTLAEEQGRMYSINGGVLKRKEPEGGLDRESFRYKQPSWQ